MLDLENTVAVLSDEALVRRRESRSDAAPPIGS